MKSFKAMMSEVAQPEPAEEKAFKAQHKVDADKHPVALETQHKGTKPKAKRKADQEGDANYDLAYESVDLEEMKVKNSDAAFKLETEISNLEKRIEKLKPLALKDDEANMKLGIAKKSLKQKQDSHRALMKEGADEEPASPDESSMAMKQADFLAYVAKEMKDHLKAGKEFPEWMQNKLSKVQQAAQDLHSNFGDHGENEDDMDEALKGDQHKIDKNKNGKIDGHDLALIRAKKNEGFASDAQRKAIWASKNEKGVKEELKGNQHKIDKNKNGKIDAHDFKLLKKESLDELKQAIFDSYISEASDKPVSPFDLKNYKSQIPTKAGEKAGFDSKKVSTGTVYTKKPVKEAAYEKDMDDKKKVIVKGVKGMKSTPFTKTFRNMAAYDKWSDSDAAGDYEVRQVMHEEIELDEITLSKKFISNWNKYAKDYDKQKNAKKPASDKPKAPPVKKEEVELDEAFKTGIVKLKDGSSMVLKKEDADVLNKMLSKMSGGSVSKMTETAMKDKNGFAEILAFAKEAA